MKSEISLEIWVDGVTAEKRDIAKKELHNHFQVLGDIVEPVPITIHVSMDFDQTVDSILQEKCGSEYRYSSKRDQVIAVAKTISYPLDNNIGFTIVFDGAVFGQWEEQQHIARLMFFSHELIHVIDEVRLFHHLGANSFFSEPTTVEDTMFRLAHDIWVDYHAERFSIESLEKAVTELDSQANITYELHEGYTKSFVESVKTLPKFLAKEIHDFKTWRTTINEFWSKVYLRLRETLILASFITAHSDALGKTNAETKEMKENESYLFFFERWNAIHSQLQSLYTSKDRFEQGILTEVSATLVSIFEHCGITLSNVENGIYVAVNP